MAIVEKRSLVSRRHKATAEKFSDWAKENPSARTPTRIKEFNRIADIEFLRSTKNT